MAYQPGNAANMAAPATISQTSLPSHSGPIVLMAARRPASSRPTSAVQHADAEVEALQDEEAGPQDRDDDEPERDELFIGTSILDGRYGRVRLGLGPRGRELLA